MSANRNGARLTATATSSDSFRSHFENMPGPAFVWLSVGDTFELVDCNLAARAMPIVDYERAMGTRAHTWYKDRPDILRDLAHCHSTGQALAREMGYTFSTSVTRQLQVTYVPVPPSHVVVHIEDITDRIEEKLQLRESERRVRALLEAIPDIVLRVDEEGRFLDCHAGDQSSMLLEPAAFIGSTIREILDPELVDGSERRIRGALDTQQIQYWEYQLVVRDELRDFEARFVPCGEREVVITIRDITKPARLEREVILTRERERVRIGRDLHDGIGQTLTGISLQLGALQKQLDLEGSPHTVAVRGLTTNVQGSIDELKRISHQLSPSISSVRRLSAALERLAEDVENCPGVTCELRVSSAAEVMDEETATHLFRIAQEATSNALRHATPGRIEVILSSTGGLLELEVLDDGVGIEPEPMRGDGTGIKNMEYRARAIGAMLSVEARPERGTRVRCALQLPAAAEGGLRTTRAEGR